ncbi:transposase [Thermaerobacter sp. FW80]|uniref:transposase n=1 Tax=Thermaerobacter sp. FW80 TaxID=2546351 RepID=UPI0014311892|nr:transposase [Thermaerobacter sp. FW80]
MRILFWRCGPTCRTCRSASSCAQRLYRYFCRLGWEDAIPDDTTLVRFRQRLGEARWQRLLHRLVEQARAKGA